MRKSVAVLQVFSLAASLVLLQKFVFAENPKQSESHLIQEAAAAVIKPRLILTAGHCVHKGSGGNNGLYTNFLFVPAYRDGAAPYKRWSWSHVITPNTWITGGGTLPNAADYAILEVSDQSFSGVTSTIGSVVGYLGYKTRDLLPNHVTMLGYPRNLDNDEKMHQVTAGSYGSGGNNTAIYGSDMREGSSGGP